MFNGQYIFHFYFSAIPFTVPMNYYSVSYRLNFFRLNMKGYCIICLFLLYFNFIITYFIA